MGRDPKEEAGGLNLFGFVGNSPINRWDRLGMDWDSSSGGGWGVLDQFNQAHDEAAAANDPSYQPTQGAWAGSGGISAEALG